MQEDRRAVLFANGQSPWLKLLALRPDDYLVAIDGGLARMQAQGLHPDLLIGDLDSVTPDQLETAERDGCEILRYPPAKNENDLELALSLVVERGYKNIVIAAALGGRIDHALGNLGLLCAPAFANLDLRADDGRTSVCCLHGPNRKNLVTEPGDLISLIPWQGVAHGVTTMGLEYPLKNEPLYPWQTRGVSNLAQGKNVQVKLNSGSLLLIRIHESSEGEEK